MIREATNSDKKYFDKFAIHPLQTWEWGEFRKKTHNIVYRFIQFDLNKKPIKVFTLTLHKIPKTQLFIGALIKSDKLNKEAIEFFKDFCRKNRIIFIKTEINIPKNKAYIKFLTKNNFKKGKTLFTSSTFVIDLDKDEEKMLKHFHPKTRYNIKKAQKEGVLIFEDNSDNTFKKYLKLTKETIERQKFFAHSQKYHELMWQTLYPNIAKLFVAKYKNEIITTWILFQWKDTLYYPYGASTHKYKNVMANNLMLWEIIKYAKKEKLKYFDLWGREEGKGFTNFKSGYNPQIVEFIGTWDLVVFKNYYNLYLLLDKFRWIFLRTKTKFVKPKF